MADTLPQFDPDLATFPEVALQHMFDRHKTAWGFGDKNWNKKTKNEFQAMLEAFIRSPSIIARGGSFRMEPHWLVIEQLPPHKCAIFQPSSQLLSGWALSDAQFNHANNPPYNLQSSQLLLFFQPILEELLNCSEDIGTLDIEYFNLFQDCPIPLDDLYPALQRVWSALECYKWNQNDAEGITTDINDIKTDTLTALAQLERQ